jgi:hypothetical protein
MKYQKHIDSEELVFGSGINFNNCYLVKKINGKVIPLKILAPVSKFKLMYYPGNIKTNTFDIIKLDLLDLVNKSNESNESNLSKLVKALYKEYKFNKDHSYERNIIRIHGLEKFNYPVYEVFANGAIIKSIPKNYDELSELFKDNYQTIAVIEIYRTIHGNRMLFLPVRFYISKQFSQESIKSIKAFQPKKTENKVEKPNVNCYEYNQIPKNISLSEFEQLNNSNNIDNYDNPLDFNLDM